MGERQDEDHSRVGTESHREPRAPACSLHPFVILRFPHFSTHYDTEVPTCWTSTVLVRCTAYYSTRTALTLHTVSVSHLLLLLPYSFPTHTRTPALVVLALVLVLMLLNSTLYVGHRPAHREKGRALSSRPVFFPPPLPAYVPSSPSTFEAERNLDSHHGSFSPCGALGTRDGGAFREEVVSAMAKRVVFLLVLGLGLVLLCVCAC